MPFGLSSAPAIMQTLISVLHKLLNRFSFVYLDDILVFSKSPCENIDHVHLNNYLDVKRKKCEVNLSELK